MSDLRVKWVTDLICESRTALEIDTSYLSPDCDRKLIIDSSWKLTNCRFDQIAFKCNLIQVVVWFLQWFLNRVLESIMGLWKVASTGGVGVFWPISRWISNLIMRHREFRFYAWCQKWLQWLHDNPKTNPVTGVDVFVHLFGRGISQTLRHWKSGISRHRPFLATQMCTWLHLGEPHQMNLRGEIWLLMIGWHTTRWEAALPIHSIWSFFAYQRSVTS
jgi:hypothetical protein